MPPLPQDSSQGDEDPSDFDSSDDLASRIINRRRWRKYLSDHQSLIADIQDLRIPACYNYPEHDANARREILDTYIEETVFHARVLVNYDPVARAFYIDQRHPHCGKMELTPAQRAHLASDPIRKLPLGKMIFILRTPFTKLCRVSFTVENVEDEDEITGLITETSFLRVRGTSWYVQVSDHRDLEEFIKGTCDDLDGKLLERYGMNASLLDKLATWFVARVNPNGCFYSEERGTAYRPNWALAGMRKSPPRATPRPNVRGRRFPRNHVYKTPRPSDMPHLQHIRFLDDYEEE